VVGYTPRIIEVSYWSVSVLGFEIFTYQIKLIDLREQVETRF